jgi:hypothetical protein
MTELEIQKTQDDIASLLELEGWSLIDNWLKHEEGNTYAKLFSSRFSCQGNDHDGVKVYLEEAIYRTPARIFVSVDIKIQAETNYKDWVILNFYSLTPEKVFQNLNRYTASLISSWEAMNQSLEIQ